MPYPGKIRRFHLQCYKGNRSRTTSTGILFALKENIPLVPPSTCSSCAIAVSFRDVLINGRVQHRGRSRVQGKQAGKTQPNTSYQLVPIPYFCEDLWYLKAAAKPFEQTIFSLKRSWTLCCPFFVGGWHYFFSTDERQQHFEKRITKVENCKYLSEHKLLCLREREGAYMKNDHSCTGTFRDNTHSHHSGAPTAAHPWARAAHASSEINWALSQFSSPPRSWHSQACSELSTTSHLSCCRAHWIKHALFLVIYLALMCG